MINIDSNYRRQGVQHFNEARHKARIEQFWAKLSGRDEHLLPFDLIRLELRHHNPRCLGLQLIPIDQIIGSLGRYNDFTRHFLPLKDSLRERWLNLESLAMRRGWPPIEVYKIGETYFVSDGNHRVAVARQMGYDTIEGYVWTFPDAPPLDPNEPLDVWLIREGERNFLAHTGLAEQFPDHGICFTTPGRYKELLAQIDDLRQKLTIVDGVEPTYPEAVAAWYEMVYLPAVQLIQESAILGSFPGRTEADLFVWLSVNQNALRQQYGDYDNLAELIEKVGQDYYPAGFQKFLYRMMHLLGRAKPAPIPQI